MTTYTIINSYTGRSQEVKLARETKCYYVVLVPNATNDKSFERRFHKSNMMNEELLLIVSKPIVAKKAIYQRVTIRTFMAATSTARKLSKHVQVNLSEYKYEDLEAIDLYLAEDHKSGFGIKRGGELVNVFSIIKGRGNDLVSFALLVGARHLDCFDGYLVAFYARHGFLAYKSEPNWVEGQPDVVYMSLVI